MLCANRNTPLSSMARARCTVRIPQSHGPLGFADYLDLGMLASQHIPQVLKGVWLDLPNVQNLAPAATHSLACRDGDASRQYLIGCSEAFLRRHPLDGFDSQADASQVKEATLLRDSAPAPHNKVRCRPCCCLPSLQCWHADMPFARSNLYLHGKRTCSGHGRLSHELVRHEGARMQHA